jgi:hypothetical protein
MNPPDRLTLPAPRDARLRSIRHRISALALVLAISSPGTIAAGLEQAPAAPHYPRYRSIDLGTPGGPNASQVDPAVTHNDRGDVIAMASTATPDPDPFTLQDDLIWHVILSDATDIVRDLGALQAYGQRHIRSMRRRY